MIYSWAGVRPRTARPGEPAGSPAVMLHDLHRKVPDYYAYTGGLLMTHRTAGRAIAAAVARRTTPSRRSKPPVYDVRLPPENQNSPPVSYDYKHVSVAALRHACAQEQARTLEDLMFRRVRLGWTERMGINIAHDVAAAVRTEMNWSPAKAHAETEAYIARAQHTFGLNI